jgi:hypothetical protein
VYEKKPWSYPASSCLHSGDDVTVCAVFVCWETSVKLFSAVRAFETSYQLFYLTAPSIVLLAILSVKHFTILQQQYYGEYELSEKCFMRENVFEVTFPCDY